MTISVALIGTRGTSATATVATGSGASTGGANSTGFLVISHDPGTTISSATDNKGNTWTLLSSVTGVAKLARYICVGMIGGAGHVVTATFSATAFATIHAFEIIGSAGAISRDAAASVATTNTQAAGGTWTATSGTLAQANSLVIAGLEQNNGTVGAYAFSPQTLLSQEPDTANFWTSGVGSQVVAATTPVTTNVTRIGSAGSTSSIFIDVFNETASGGVPSITSVSSATPANGSNLTITGTNFGATQGAQTVTIGGTVCSVVSWSNTSVVVTVARGLNKYGVALNTIITGGNTFAGITGIQPQAGWSFINIGTPNATASLRLTASPDIASGDQVAWDNKSSTVNVFTDATFSAGGAVANFDFEVWSTGSGWGTIGTQSMLGVGPRRHTRLAGFPVGSIGWQGVASATGNQNLLPSLYVNSNTFYAHNVTRGAVNLSPSLFANSNTFYTHVVSQTGATQNLSPTLYANVNTFYVHALSGSYALTPNLFVNANAFPAHTVSAGAVALLPNIFASANVFYSHTVSSGSGPQSLLPSLYVSANAFYAHTLISTATVLPSLFANANTFYAPSITASLNLQPSLFANSNTFYAPALSASAIIAPPLFASSNVFYAHAISAAGATQNLLPALYVNANTFYAPTLLSAAALFPTLFANAPTFYVHAANGSYAITPGLYQNPNVFYAATVANADAALSPPLFGNINTFYQHLITGGSIAAPPSSGSRAAPYAPPRQPPRQPQYQPPRQPPRRPQLNPRQHLRHVLEEPKIALNDSDDQDIIDILTLIAHTL